MAAIEINPILVKELRSRMRGSRAFVLMTFYLLVLGAVTLLLYAALSSSAGTDINAGRQIGKSLFIVIAGVALVEVCFITPALTSGAIAGERERQTYDLLVTSLLSPWQILWGKLASALAFAMLLILSVVPVMSLAFLFGGVSLAEVLIALAGLIATAITYATLGLFWSTIMRGSLGATAFSIGSVVVILLGVPFLMVIFLIIFGRGDTSDLFESPFFIYLSRIAFGLHPFIALGITESLLSSGSSPFVEVVPTSAVGRSITLPSPWIMYVIVSLILSGVMLLFAVRSLQPTQPEVATKPTAAKPAKSKLPAVPPAEDPTA
jgi:ABC-type transport system involved in multi-copper enzyme maturation permease subunit